MRRPARTGAAAALRPDRPPRRLVGAAGGDLHRPRELRRLRHLGGVPERALHLRPVPVALLLAGDVRRLAPRAGSGRKPGWWPGWLPFSPGPAHPPVPGALPLHLLLLPRRLLQGVLGGPAHLRRGRAARKSYWGERCFPLDPAERPPLLPLHRAALPRHPGVRRLQGHVVRRPGYGGTAFGIGVGTLVLAANVVLLGGYTLGCHSLRHLVGGRIDQLSKHPVQTPCYEGVQQAEPQPHEVGVGQPVLGGASATCTSGCARWGSGPTGGSSDGRSTRRVEHDVLVIGAGGAGLRAAIEAAAAGVRGGAGLQVAAGQGAHGDGRGRRRRGLANVDDRDSWQVHFADTMRGGQYLNNWRMAELHAQEAPDRVRELEAWGALFDRTRGRPHPAAQLRRAPLSAPGARRRPHRAGDDPHPAGPRHPPGHRRAHGVHRRHAAQGRRPRRAARSAYDRERGRFRLFRAKAVVLATGGIGRAYKITSNSWEYTGDGHALAYDAGADADGHGVRAVPPHRDGLAAQRARHPGDRGGARRGRRAAATARAAASCSTTSPRTTSAQTADSPEEGWRYTQGDKDARRPPELLTRDHVARCIVREVREGRGSPHGGVFLDIAWIKEKLPDAAEHIRKKLPSMYHQFKQLADIDITTEPMEVGPTTHYVMGGVRVDGDTQMSTVPGLFAAGECAAGLHGANRLGGNSLSRPAGLRQARGGARGALRPRERRRATSNAAQVDEAARAARWRRSTAARRRRAPYQVQHDLQEMMQDLVGIVAAEDEMERALEGLAARSRRARRSVGVRGNREYNPGWHTALDLHNLLTVSEAVTRARARAQGEPRRPLPRRLSREGRGVRHLQPGAAQGPGRGDADDARAHSGDAGRAAADHRGEPMSTTQRRRDRPRRTGCSRARRRSRAAKSDRPRPPSAAPPSASGAATRAAATFQDYTTEVTEGMVVLDAVHQIQAEQANDLAVRWNCKAGKCGSCSAEVNGMPQADVHDAAERPAPRRAGHGGADAGLPAASATW